MSSDKIHWIAVGEITERAKNALENIGGTLQKIDTPSVFLVGIPCNLLPAHAIYTEFRITTRTTDEEAFIHVPSRKLELIWSCQTGTPPTEASIHETALDLYVDEED